MNKERKALLEEVARGAGVAMAGALPQQVRVPVTWGDGHQQKMLCTEPGPMIMAPDFVYSQSLGMLGVLLMMLAMVSKKETCLTV